MIYWHTGIRHKVLDHCILSQNTRHKSITFPLFTLIWYRNFLVVCRTIGQGVHVLTLIKIMGSNPGIVSFFKYLWALAIMRKVQTLPHAAYHPAVMGIWEEWVFVTAIIESFILKRGSVSNGHLGNNCNVEREALTQYRLKTTHL